MITTEFIRTAGQKETIDDRTIYRLFAPGDRYMFDFSEEYKESEWMQFDTDQDAAYFGVWVNPKLLQTLSYAEGDWTHTLHYSRTSYNEEIERMCEFYGEGYEAITISDNGDRTVYRQDRSLFLIP